jgi:hypothetical protein
MNYVEAFEKADLVLRFKDNHFFIIKDRQNRYTSLISLFGHFIDMLFDANVLSIAILDENDEVIRHNLDDSSPFLESAQDFLSEVALAYDSKVDAIDKALANGDKETFLSLTADLYGGVADGVH